ncbi:hypothetical protein [Litchfieldia salsa]|uniref:Uncharacterized protein n=1 Tax=Litchfieldia salsa TaxID=930152 RepID=A0A1H0S549_9BACI|nr:hypothetical protein [Litchfieldia salsa]SDP36860.1 hypothetical protein SAMN05216565_102547 [Litchfieldia salsa]
MFNYIMDFTIVAILVIGITAVMGIITNGIGIKFFGGSTKSEFVDQSNKMQTGWKNVGGR